MKPIWMFVFVNLFFLLGCRPVTAVTEPQQVLQSVTAVPPLVPIVKVPTQLPLSTLVPIPTLIKTETAVSPSATSSSQPTNIPTTTPSPTATATPLPPIPIPCQERMPTHDLLAIVTKIYGISPTFEPLNLVPIEDYFPHDVTLGYPTEIRTLLIEPLYTMINDMQLAGLRPQILSGYRSYTSQAIAYEKWVAKYPDRADILSAPPGHSEHQLGTTVDFGSPELIDLVGPGFQFHTHFYMTSEGIWLAENAHSYGFSLSYPREATELTGFAYEPWHFRYVGVERASWLKSQNSTLMEQQLSNFPPPCIPNE